MSFPTPFTSSGETDLQQSTDLALYLLRYLEHRRDPHERIWRGERGLRTLQNACQVLEALHELGLKGLTNHLVEPAANWLLALPLDLPPEDLRTYRLFPWRFKTVAQLGRFDGARLMPDFEVLCDLFDTETGWIHDAPTDLHPTLVTALWLDTLLFLEEQGPLATQVAANRDQALQALSASFDVWLNEQQAQQPANGTGLSAGLRPGAFAHVGDASYAFAVLVRAGQLLPDSPGVETASQVFTRTLAERHAADLHRMDLLHCALNLQLSIEQQAETWAAAQSILGDLCQGYENDECQREPLAYHALVLQLLAVHYGEALRTSLLERLWKDSLASAEAEQRQELEQLESEFVNLIRQSIRVHLAPPQRITGTRARGEVYRLRFGLTTESTDEHGSPLSTPRETLRLIVKKGSPDVLARAIERYHHLPEPLQHLFARHADIPADQAPGYLIMQDLADMLPLSEVLAQLDRPVVLPEERERAVHAVAETAGGLLAALHSYERRPSLVSHQLDVVYLAPMTVALERLARPSAFPELRDWLAATLEINQRRYRRLGWYLHQLRRHEAQLNPASLGYIHGDCHSRNVMLNRDWSLARFVDIETLTSADDYIVDYGLLIEDIAVYQSLPYGSERGRVEWDDIRTTRPAPGDAAGRDRHGIAYPAFPRSAAVVEFQTILLRQLRTYAEGIEDAGWQARLWLAIARGLLLLATRQLTSHTVEPQRRVHSPRYVNDVRLVQVSFAEAIRLLAELTEHLNAPGSTPLPDLPFSGEHRAPSDGPERATLAAINEALAQAFGEAVERRPVTERPELADYITRPGQQLFARLATRSQQPVLYLAARPDDLDDPQGLVQPLGPEDTGVLTSGLGSRVAINTSEPVEPIIELLQQAYELARQRT